MSCLTFDIRVQSQTTHARLGRVTTPHGSFDTPAFMPVGTQATVKGLLPEMVAGLEAQIILANTYHLMLRPGGELIEQMGGLHQWMGWNRPILTDSGGFQVFSLSDINKINDEGVTFKSHLDGSMIDLTPQRSIQVQNQLGADIIMQFDDCPPARGPMNTVHGKADNGAENVENPDDEQRSPLGGPGQHSATKNNANHLSEEDYNTRVRESCQRSVRWLELCVAAHQRQHEQALFGIIQGGTDLNQRQWCVDQVCSFDLPGYAIGGVAVGEGFEQLKAVVDFTAPRMPANKPRYLMGVGYERDILTAVRAGVDMFDCVLPTRNGRNANAFTPTGQIRLRNASFARDPRVIDANCDCPACGPRGWGGGGGDGGNVPTSRDAKRGASVGPCGGPSGGLSGGGVSRSYIRHLFMAKEMLGPILVSCHNIRHFQRFLLDIRKAIADNDWPLVSQNWPIAVS